MKVYCVGSSSRRKIKCDAFHHQVALNLMTNFNELKVALKAIEMDMP